MITRLKVKALGYEVPPELLAEIRPRSADTAADLARKARQDVAETVRAARGAEQMAP